MRARVLVTVQPAAQPDCEDPPAAARAATSTLDLVIVRAFHSTPGAADPNLCHNILDLQLTLPDGTATACDFLTHYETTGGLARWGYATSEILEEAPGALTQYYQRGAVDCHFRVGQWRMERRLTWDFIGGGLGGASDPGVEPPRSEYPGLFPGPWGLRVSNFAVDGTFTGFRDFFQAHGGVAAFGYPKTEARYDDDPAAVLRPPRDRRRGSSGSTSRRPCSNFTRTTRPIRSSWGWPATRCATCATPTRPTSASPASAPRPS